ncbi:MAG: FtsW/RodA/SpoVE family cell cycle protein [Ilumatobacteraceae bacterium]
MSANSPVARHRRNPLSAALNRVSIHGTATLYRPRPAALEHPLALGPFLGIWACSWRPMPHPPRRLALARSGYPAPARRLRSLSGISFVMIARLDAKGLAGLQATWTLVGIALYVGDAMPAVRRVNDLRRYQWTFFIVGITLQLLPFLPVIGGTSTAPGSGSAWARSASSPVRSPSSAWPLFFAGYLTERRELISAGTWRVGPFNPPRTKALFPIAAAWAISVVVMHGRPEGPQVLAAVLHPLRRDAVGRHGEASYLVIGALMFAGAAFTAFRLFGHVQTRVNIWLDPWQDYEGKGYQIAQAMFAFGSGGLTGSGLGLGLPTRDPARPERLHLRRHRRGTQAVQLLTTILLLHAHGRAGLRTAMRSERTFEEAARRRVDHDPRGAGVHHPRRGRASCRSPA